MQISYVTWSYIYFYLNKKWIKLSFFFINQFKNINFGKNMIILSPNMPFIHDPDVEKSSIIFKC